MRLARARFDDVAVVAKDPDRYAGCGATLLRDASAARTPLSGLLAGLSWCRADALFAFGVDMPFAVDAALLEALEAAGGGAAVPVHGGVPQPLSAIWRPEPCLAVSVAETLGPLALARAAGAAFLEWSDPRPFLDCDTRGDLEKLA